jgi:hypothetical protein
VEEFIKLQNPANEHMSSSAMLNVQAECPKITLMNKSLKPNDSTSLENKNCK